MKSKTVRLEVHNVARLHARLLAMHTSSKAEHDVSVTVGYTAEYSIHVHENLEARHPVGQAKFLESAAREMAQQAGALVARVVKSGGKLVHGLLAGGMLIQRTSQERCPVDTGALRASAFTEVDGD